MSDGSPLTIQAGRREGLRARPPGEPMAGEIRLGPQRGGGCGVGAALGTSPGEDTTAEGGAYASVTPGSPS